MVIPVSIAFHVNNFIGSKHASRILTFYAVRVYYLLYLTAVVSCLSSSLYAVDVSLEDKSSEIIITLNREKLPLQKPQCLHDVFRSTKRRVVPIQYSSVQCQTKYTIIQVPCSCLQQHNVRKVRMLEDINHVHKKGISIDKECNK
jgi:hypothetical protein